MKTEDLIRTMAADLPTSTATAGTTLSRSLPLAAVVMAAGWLAFAGVRADLLTTGLQATLLKLSLGALIALSSLWIAIKLARPEQDTSPCWWLAVVPAVVVLAVGADLVQHGTARWTERVWGYSIAACLSIIPALAIIPLAGTLLALREGATRHPALVGALAGVGSGGIAILAYGLFCTEDATLFVATWYVLATCLAGAIGALAGAVALRW